jgi:DNA helicase-2/ATP-dependent DNA helicase PcrA
VPLKRQAVLFRTSHHSDLLEVELTRRNIPFVKFGGLKFLEAAHVKDMVALLRWAENPLDSMAAFRTVQLLPGIGPGTAHKIVDQLDGHNGEWESLRDFPVPAAAQQNFPGLVDLMVALSGDRAAWPGDVGRAREWYAPYLDAIYDAAPVRAGDLEQMEQIASQYPSRERFLTEITIDPPEASGDHAGPPHLDEDYLILSTIHSAKGLEWDVVHLIHASDGNIPSDMALRDDDELEEERRLLYVALTRPRDALYVSFPQRFHHRPRGRDDKHSFALVSRFLEPVQGLFEVLGPETSPTTSDPEGSPAGTADVDALLADLFG